MSGVVTQHLIGMVRAQVDRHGIVVWFDPERQYGHVAESLEMPEGAVHSYTDSFLALRHAVDRLLNDLQVDRPPRLVVYVPLGKEQTDDALVELTAAGVELRPGYPAHERNTRLAVVARAALRHLPAETVQPLVAQVESGKLSLADLDEWLARGGEAETAAVQAIYGMANAPEVALTFLTDPSRDTEVQEREVEGDLLGLVESAYDVALRREKNLAQARERLARHVLLTELLAMLDQLAEEIPAALRDTYRPRTAAAQLAAVRLAQQWRTLRTQAGTYAAHADQVERGAGLARLTFSLEQLAAVETFRGLEVRLQVAVEEALIDQPHQELVELAVARSASFWSAVDAAHQARWVLMASAGRLLLETERVAADLKRAPQSPGDMICRYAAKESGWWVMDAFHRRLEQRALAFDFDLHGTYDALQRLVARARQRYAAVANDLAESFAAAREQTRFRVDGLLRQREIYGKAVAPLLAEQKTAYVLVDALRYEMACELVEGMAKKGVERVALEPAFAAAPTVTEVGMAALLPKAETGAALVEAGTGKLALQLDGQVLKDRKDRMAYIASQVTGRVYETKLDAVYNPRPAVRRNIKEADLVVVTSQEIDWLCEGDNVALARRTMDGMLPELRRAFRVLAELGVRRIVVAADHGFIFGEELETDMKIDPPGGQTVDLHRRVWVGRGGQDSPSTLRASAAQLGWAGNLDVVVPRSLAAFRAGGARAYFHGGLSLQECVVPVLTVHVAAPAQEVQAAETWIVKPGSSKITSPFVSVQVTCSAAELLELRPRRVRVEIRLAGESGPASVPVAAAYGFDETTGTVRLRLAEEGARRTEPNTITLMLSGDVKSGMASVHVIDGENERQVHVVEGIEIAIERGYV